MTTNRLTLRPLHDKAETAPEALIIVLFIAGDGQPEPERLARRWRPVVPRALFAEVELAYRAGQVDRLMLRRIVAAAAGARGIAADKVVLVGLGEAAGLAVDLVLHGSLPALGVIAFDIPTAAPSAPFAAPFAAGRAKIRLVQRATDDPKGIRFHQLIHDLRRCDIDVRATILPDESQAWDIPMRAGISFLVELVAEASRLPPTTAR